MNVGAFPGPPPPTQHGNSSAFPPAGHRNVSRHKVQLGGRPLLTRNSYSSDRRASALSPRGRLGRIAVNSTNRPPLGRGSQGPATRDRRGVLLPAAQNRG